MAVQGTLPRTAIIGCGAIGEEIVARFVAAGAVDRVVVVLERPHNVDRARDLAAGRFPVVDRLDEVVDRRPQIAVECAGHNAVAAFGPALLRQGIDFLVASCGCLAERGLAKELVAAATSPGGGRLLVPSGAVAGLDGLLAARAEGLGTVTYRSAKPPVAWRGTLAEAAIDLARVSAPTVFFEGSARDAALSYPKNANVGVAVALAGIGLEKTRVHLVADPALKDPLGIIEAEGTLGRFRFETLAYAAPGNPKTSRLTAHSLMLALEAGWAFSPVDALAAG
jgi:aspartate dehydrogenase